MEAVICEESLLLLKSMLLQSNLLKLGGSGAVNLKKCIFYSINEFEPEMRVLLKLV